jgi:hypothetical protein
LLYTARMYRMLDRDKLLETIQLFRQRIVKVFPSSGLSEVSGELEDTAKLCFTEAEKVRRPLWGLRIAVALVLLLLLAMPLLLFLFLRFPMRFDTLENFGEFMQATDAGFNVLVLIAGAALFLVSVEHRVKRHRALKVLHELRSLAHVVDMHQLSKDPVMDVSTLDDNTRVGAPPKAIKQAQDLWYYLSFSTDLLSVIGKLAAYFAQGQSDRVVLDTVNEIETISTALSRKIWQKLSLVKPPQPTLQAPPVRQQP